MDTNKTLNVLVGCELSGVVRNAFAALGHNAFSCDLKSSDDANLFHLQMDLFEAITIMKWDLAILHPPCTFIAVTGNKWYYHPDDNKLPITGRRPHPRFPDRRKHREEAKNFFMKCVNVDIPFVAVENPVGIMSTSYRKPDQIFQPYQFGHKEPKKTCLWLKELPALIPTKIVEPEYHLTKSGKRLPKWYTYADKSKGQEHRAKIRSKTFPGVAKAMASQWSEYIISKMNN